MELPEPQPTVAFILRSLAALSQPLANEWQHLNDYGHGSWLGFVMIPLLYWPFFFVHQFPAMGIPFTGLISVPVWRSRPLRSWYLPFSSVVVLLAIARHTQDYIRCWQTDTMPWQRYVACYLDSEGWFTTNAGYDLAFAIVGPLLACTLLFSLAGVLSWLMRNQGWRVRALPQQWGMPVTVGAIALIVIIVAMLAQFPHPLLNPTPHPNQA